MHNKTQHKAVRIKFFRAFPFFFKHVKKRLVFYPIFSQLITSSQDFGLAFPKQRLKGWEPQLVVPYQDQNLGNHNLWFPIKIKRLGATTCGSLSKSICWEPQPVVPNQNQYVGNHNLWLPIKIKRMGTTDCDSQPFNRCLESINLKSWPGVINCKKLG